MKPGSTAPRRAWILGAGSGTFVVTYASGVGDTASEALGQQCSRNPNCCKDVSSISARSFQICGGESGLRNPVVYPSCLLVPGRRRSSHKQALGAGCSCSRGLVKCPALRARICAAGTRGQAELSNLVQISWDGGRGVGTRKPKKKTAGHIAFLALGALSLPQAPTTTCGA